MTLRKVRDRIYADTDGKNGGNLGAVVLDDEVVVVDSGMVHTLSRKVRQFVDDTFGLPILKLVITHSHSDHVFGAQAFDPTSIIGSMNMRRVCERNLSGQWKIDAIRDYVRPVKDERLEFWASLDDLEIRIPDIVFDNRLFIGREKDMTVQLVGGHTTGSSIVVIEPEHIAFVGDLIFNGSFPYAGDPTCDPDRWIMSLEGIKAAEYEQIIPGHGPVCGQDEIARHLDFLSTLRERIKHALLEGLTSEEFLEQDLLPEYYVEGADRRSSSTVEHWFGFYKAVGDSHAPP